MTNTFSSSGYYGDDYFNSTAIFSQIKKTVISKEFNGGQIYNLFGATKINFANADIKGVAVLDIEQLFGETKITVPADWQVRIDLTQILADTADKRGDTLQATGSDKILVIKGLSVFANVVIKQA